MQKAGSIRLRPLHVRRVKNKAKVWFFPLPWILLFFGIVIGSIYESYSRNSGQVYITFFIEEVVSIYSADFLSVMSFVFLSSFTIHLIMLFFSFCCIGLPVIFLLPVLKGIFIGCINGYLYGTMGAQGVFANLLILFLPQIIEAITISVLCTHAVQLSTGLYRQITSKNKDVNLRVDLYIRYFIFSSIFLLLSSFLTAALSFVFAPVFLQF